MFSHILRFLGSGPPVPAPDLLMQIKQEGELQLQEQQALGVEAWAAGQPDIGEEPWGLSQLDSGAGDVSTDATSGEWLRRRADAGKRGRDEGQVRGQEFPEARTVGAEGFQTSGLTSLEVFPT